MSGAAPEPNPKFNQALAGASRLHSLLLSTATCSYLVMSDAALIIQQGREEIFPIVSFLEDAEDQLERTGRADWAALESFPSRSRP